MTTETYLETADPMEAYLEGLRSNVASAALDFQRGPTTETYERYVAASRLLQREMVTLYGVDCPECSGEGEPLMGWTPATWSSPPEPILGLCKECRGRGRVLPHIAVAYYERHGLSQAEARERVT